MSDSEKYYIEIPEAVVNANRIHATSDITAVFSNGRITLKEKSADNQNERSSIRGFLLTSLLAGILAFIVFHIQELKTVPLRGGNSIAQVSIYLSLFFGTLAFFGTVIKVKKHKLSELKWRHIITLTLAAALILFAVLAMFFKIFSTAFIGLRLDMYTTSILVGLVVGISTYSLSAAANSINFSTITYTLIALLFGGILFSMITNGRPDWWQHNFSYLGTENVKNAMYFNFTLIFSGLIMLTLVDYLFSGLHATFNQNRRMFYLRILFSLLAITLAGVGLFPNNPGWTHTVHDHIAQLLVLWILIMIVGIKWLLPDASHEFTVTSYTVGVLLILSDILFQHLHYLSLTGFEVTACGLVFFWLIILLLHLRNLALPEAQFQTKIIKANSSSI
ncbi:DUF998 domain-containing protein [Weissella viridescens]|uniref:DUF998 domain-containing protein n=1 Tax=Weissella viridescens TaxID=1629 RepID=UPI0025774E7E|nr:DUF998 domain-containing protein [Weissella viridescens]WJI91791.1 DUF998 domain-containing protein [Weissella viridescens]